MLVQATRAVSNWGLRAAFYVSLFTFVVVAHIACTTALRTLGAGAGLALLISGAAVLAVVLGANGAVALFRKLRAQRNEREAAAVGLPDGPFCLAWAPDPAWETPMPWRLAKPIRVPYPRLARRMGAEGIAVIAFEIGSDGRARHLHCVDAWPHDAFYDAAATALRDAHFIPKRGVRPRMGEPYRLPFLFRIAGSADIAHAGPRARPHRPMVSAAALALERFRRAA